MIASSGPRRAAIVVALGRRRSAAGQCARRAQAAAAPLRSEVRADHGVVAAGRTFTADAGAQMMAPAATRSMPASRRSSRRRSSRSRTSASAARRRSSSTPRATSASSSSTARGRRRRPRRPRCSRARTPIPGNGPLGATIPAVVDAAAIALEKYGTKSLAEVLAPAIALADGFPMYTFLENYLEYGAQGVGALRVVDPHLLSGR